MLKPEGPAIIWGSRVHDGVSKGDGAEKEDEEEEDLVEVLRGRHSEEEHRRLIEHDDDGRTQVKDHYHPDHAHKR